MAIHVRTDYCWIKFPEQFQSKMTDIVYIAALAKKLNEHDIFNEAKKAFDDLRNQWEREGSALAKKNSSTNWLGGGTVCMREPMLPWEFSFKLSEAIVEDIPINECAKELKKALLEL
ncbi:MAG: hypothetical protein II200_02955 [Bacteroidaceae bacterium]|nr:hypothetical protein [Bacteroidaceae bacterium]